MAINIYGRHLLTLKDFTPQEISFIIELSKKLKTKRSTEDTTQFLHNKNIVLLFEKESTRTRCAFEVAAKEEGANVTFLANSHIGKKESIEDTAKVLGRYYDGIQFRGYRQQTIETLAKNAGIPVWNGLTDDYHPTQALADILTIKEHVNKSIHNVKIVFVGDTSSNTAISLMIGAAKLGMHFVALSPEKLYPHEQIINQSLEIARANNATIEFTSNINQAVKNADIIYTDVWFSMGEEKKMAERIELLKPYQVNQSMLKKSENPKIKFMHCLPAFHDTKTHLGKHVYNMFGLTEMEVSDEVFNGSNAIVFDQAENRLHTIKAVMIATIGSKKLT